MGRGKSKYGSIRPEELNELLGKLTFDILCSSTEGENLARPSSAARQLKVARPQPRSPAPRADPEGQFVYK